MNPMTSNSKDSRASTLPIRLRLFLFLIPAAFLAMPVCARTFAQDAGGSLWELWPALVGLAIAGLIAFASVLAIRGAKRTSGFDDVTVWRALAENTTETVFLLSRKGIILYVNRWSGDTNEVIAKPFASFVKEQDRSRWQEFFVMNHLQESPSSAVTYQIELPELEAVWQLRLTALEPPAGEAEFMLCARDVTEEHRRLARKDVLYRITMTATQTESLAELVHFAEEQLAGVLDTTNFFLALYNKESDSYLRLFSRDIHGRPYGEGMRENLKGGLTDYVRTSGKPLLVNDGNREQLKAQLGIVPIGKSAACWLGVPLIVGTEVQGVFVVQSYDNPNCYSEMDAEFLSIIAASIGRVLEREQAHTKIVSRESKLRLLTDRLPALIWSEDRHGYITYAAGTALTEMGLSPEVLLGHKLTEIVSTETGDIETYDREMLSSDSKFRFKYNHRTFDAFIETLLDEHGECTGLAGVALDITERDRADSELRHFTSLSTNSFVVMDKDSVLHRCNDGYLKTTGYTREERIGLTTSHLVHPDDVAAAASAFQRLFTGETVVAQDMRVLCKDGSYKWIAWNAVFNPEDELVYCSGTDITHLRQMEVHLRESKEHLRLFIQHSPAALAMFDREMKYLVVSDRWRVDYNLGDQEIIGKSHYEVFPEIGDEWKAIHQRCLQGATESCAKDPFPREDGSLDWVRWQITPWYSGEGEISGIIMFTEVITAEVEADLELARSRNLARQIIASSIDAVVAIDGLGVVTEWNDRAEQMFGYTRAEAVDRYLHELIIPAEQVEKHVNGLRRHLKTGEARILNKLLSMTARHKDGREIPVEMSIGAIPVGDETHYSAFIRDITERRQRELELNENRHRLKEAQRLAGLGFWEWDAATGDLQLSEEKLALYELHDLPLPTTMDVFMQIVHPDDRQRLQQVFQQIIETGQGAALQYKIVRPSGEIRHAYSQGEAEYDSNGVLRRVFGTTLDITERVVAEERVRSSEERLALAFEGSSDGFWDWNVVSGDCYFSPRIVEWLEFDPHEFQHHVKFWEELIHPDYLQAFNEAYREHVDNQTTHYEIEERVRTKSGSWIWVLSRGKVVQWNEDGTPLRAAGTWTNITSRKIMEARATQLGRILDKSVNEVYVIDPMTLQIVEANQRASQNTGYTVQELMRLTIPELQQDWDEGELKALGAPLLAGTVEAIRSEGTHVRKDGTTYPIEVAVQLMEWYDKTVFVSVVSDVTDKRKAEQEFENLQAQLRHAQRLETIGTLAGGIAHDFNNILTPILGYADMAASEMDPESNSRRDIEQVIQAAYRAKGLVQQILAFSRQSEQVRHPLNIDMVVKETLRLMRASVPPHIEIIQNIENVGTVLSDPTLLNQILMNLCTNAYQAISDESGEIEITLTSERVREMEFAERGKLSDGLYAKLTVRDTGAGMDAATIGRIFEPFFTTKEVGQGTGLGLSVVHGIVQAHGGAITVDSRPGLGSRVTVYLPLLSEPEHCESEIQREIPRGSEHLLLCDDDEAILTLATHMLESFGYRVTAVGDPVSALALLAQADPPIAALLVDDRMPILSGLHVALAAHDFKPELPVILLSASASLELEDSPFAAVLSKPVAASDLAFAVRNAINNTYKTEVL